MKSYSDGIEFYPPAPVVKVDVYDPADQTKREQNIKCVLDPGASITTIPEKNISSLKLTPTDAVKKVTDWQGKKVEDVSCYPAIVYLCGREFKVKVFGAQGNIGLIGRDILNEWIALLNGPKKEFSLYTKEEFSLINERD